MEKYEELEKLQKLKENGTLNNAEFELEKQKILSKDDVKIKEGKNYKKGLAKIFFIIFGVSVVVSIILSIIYFYWQSALWFDVWIQNGKNMTMIDIITNIFIVSLILFWGTTIVLLIIGTLLRIKEKGGIKIVD